MLGRAPSREHSQERLTERRRRSRRRIVVIFSILLGILLGALVYGLEQSEVRISRVEVVGASQSLTEHATRAMKGVYFGIIPRDSILFFPEDRIRTDISTADNNIAAVSIRRSGLTSISIKVDYRVPIARWCGSTSSPQVASSEEYCYVFDSSGLIYSVASPEIIPVNSFTLYAPLVDDVEEPLLATLMYMERVPTIFDFARNIRDFGSSVVSVVIHDGQVDNILENGARISYVFGDEENAFTALVSARDTFNLADSSIDYIDLRFDGKVYLKRK